MLNIKVLLIDDEPDLLDLSKRYLEMTDGLVIGTCDSAKEALSRLCTEGYDVIVSDYQMPEMDGLQLLRSLREMGNKTQFILFTGKGREDVAVAALNLGATFYLQKGGDFRAQFAELSNMIRRAAETTRSAAMLRESESKFRSYIENSPEGIAVVNEEGRYLEVNRAFCAMTGYDEIELLGLNLERMHPQQGDHAPSQSFARLRAEGSTSHDSPFLRKDGGIRHWHIDAVRLADGRFIGFHSDITQKKQMMDQVVWRERMLELMARHNPLGVLMVDQENERLIYSNSRFFEVWGMPSLEGEAAALGMDARQLLQRCLAQTKDPEQFKARIMKGLLAREVEYSEDEIELRDGRILRRVFNKVKDSEGRFLGRFYIFEDITERRREEELLRDREEIYRTLYECSGDAIILLGNDRRCIAANPQAVRLFGLMDEEELCQLNLEDLSPEYQLDGTLSRCAIAQLNRRITAEGSALFEWTHARKDGSVFSAMVRLTVMTIGGQVVEQAIIRDISEQKALSKELEQSNSTLRTILDSVADAIFVIGLDVRILDINRRAMEMFHITHGEALALSLADDLSAPGLAGSISERIWAKVIAGEEQFIEWRSRRPHDGSTFDSEAYLQRVMIGGRPAILCSVRNVSGRRKAEEELRQRAARLAILYEIISIGGQAPTVAVLAERSLEAVMSVMEFASGGIYLVEPGSTVAELVVSRGLDAEALQRVSRCEIDQPPYRQLFIDQAPIFTSDFHSIANPQKGVGGIMTVASVPLLGRGGVIGCMNVGTPSRRMICEEERSLLLAIGKELGSSVERRRAQEMADTEHANLTSLFDSITDMVFVLDLDGTIIEANGAAVIGLGYRREEMIGKNVAMLHDPEYRADAMRTIASMVAGNQKACQMAVRTREGNMIPVETLVTQGKWNGRPCLIGTTRDISDKVAAEVALRQSEEKYRLLVENAGEAVTVVQDGVFRFVNDRASELTGYSREELLDHPIVGFACPEDRESVHKNHISRQEGGSAPLRHMVRVMGRDDAIKWFDVKAARIEWEGRPATLNFYSDMTERLHNEEALQQANRQLNLMSSITRHDILNSITVMLGLLELAKRDEVEQTPELRRSLEKMRQHTRLIQSHVEFTRIYQDIGSQAPKWQDLGAMLARQRVPQGLQMEVHCEGLQVLADPMLEKVFHNLLDNTARHAMKATQARVSCQRGMMGMDIVYEDDGIGIPNCEKERIFAYGHGRNNGLGLFLVREILSITQMRICENGIEGKGARFVIHVPKGIYRGQGPLRGTRP